MGPEEEHALIEHNLKRLGALRAAETVVFDRCALDALAHARVAKASGNQAFTADWLDLLARKTRQALSVVDLLVVVRIDPQIPLAEDGIRSNDEVYREQVDREIAGIAREIMSIVRQRSGWSLAASVVSSRWIIGMQRSS